MYWNNQSFILHEENLAWDEACVELADKVGLASNESFEILRLWSFSSPTVVLGRASRVEEEVFVDRCQRDRVGIFRRASGGSTIVAGPGCLMYSILISYLQRPSWRSIDVAHREVMSRIAEGVEKTLAWVNQINKVKLQGTCDLTLGDYKFSGNAVRCKRQGMLYHGTILLDMPGEWVETYLKEPPRQPEYREKRTHAQFVRNLLSGSSVDRELFEAELIERLKKVWKADEDWASFSYREELAGETAHLLEKRYLNRGWHFDR